MATSTKSDGELLLEWLKGRQEDSFRTLVERHAGMVHMASKRICEDENVAAEACQLAFILLARKAPLLAGRPSLAGWLHLTAVMQTKNLMRRNQRELRKRRQLLSEEERGSPARDEADWKELRPFIDDAVASLPERDREAICLHFYRSLGVREISGILRIAPEAVRKRIQRATEKLRAALLRRGCRTSGALAVVLATGFSADVQAALPVAVISTKATAAVAPGGSIFLPASTVMKGMTLLPPVAALLVAGFWIGSRRDAAARVEAENRSLVESIDTRKNPRSEESPQENIVRGTARFGNGKGGINWEAVSESFSERKRIGVWGAIDSVSQVRLSYLLSKMAPEERLAQLDLVDTLQVSAEIKEMLEQEIALRLAWDKPALVLDHLASRLPGNSMTTHLMTLAFSNVAKSDPGAAVRWLDGQIEAGRFASKRLDGVNHQRVSMEAVLVGRLLQDDPEAASGRINALPGSQVAELFQHLGNDWRRQPEDQDGYVRLVRAHLPEKEQLGAFKVQVEALAQDFSKAGAFLDRLELSPNERSEMMSAAGIGNIVGVSCNRNVSKADLDKMREWVAAQAPGEMDRITGQALAGASERGVKLGFGHALELAEQYGGTEGADDVMVALLGSDIATKNKALAREAALRIRNEEQREIILEKLK